MMRSGLIFKKSVDSSTKPTSYDSSEKILFMIAQKSEIITTNWFRQVTRRSRKRYANGSMHGNDAKKQSI